MLDLALSLLVLAAIALIGGGAYLWRRNGFTRQVQLMLVLAMVMIANVAIWTLPDTGGEAPLDRLEERR